MHNYSLAHLVIFSGAALVVLAVLPRGLQALFSSIIGGVGAVFILSLLLILLGR